MTPLSPIGQQDNELLIKGETDTIRLTVVAFDYGMYNAVLTVTSAHWHVKTRTRFDREDLTRVRDELHRFHESLSGEATLTSCYRSFQIALRADKFGHLFLDGYVGERYEPHSGNRFYFYAAAGDQSYLPGVLNQVESLIQVQHTHSWEDYETED